MLITSCYSPCLAQENNRDDVYAIFKKSYRKKLSINKQHALLNCALEHAKQANDIPKILKAYDIKTFLFSFKEEKDSTIFYAKKSIELSTIEKDSIKLLYAYNRLANGYRFAEKMDAALNAYEIQLELSQKLANTNMQVNAYNCISLVKRKMGLSFESENIATKAIALIDKQKNKEYYNSYLTALYNGLGIIYKERKEYDQALAYYKNGLSFTDDPSEQNIFLNNIGNIYLKSGSYEKAKYNFQLALDNAYKLNNEKQVARALCNLGGAKYNLNDTLAIDNIAKSLEIRSSLDYKAGMYSSYHQMAKAYKYFKNNNKALEYAGKAYETAKVLNTGEEQLESLKLLIDLGSSNYIQPYIVLRDSMEMLESGATYKYMSLKYNYQKEHQIAQENELKYLGSEVSRKFGENKRVAWKWGLFILGILSVIIGGSAYITYRKKRLAEVYATETRIAKQVHDEIANDIYYTMNKIQHQRIDEETTLHTLDDIYQRSRDISKKNGSLEIDENFSKTLEDLLKSYKTNNNIIITTGINSINWSYIEKQGCITLYRVLQELMTNMSKHSKAKLVKVSFTQNKRKIYIEYWDNGIGTNLKNKSGLSYVENRIKTLGGKIIFDSEINKGFKANIIL
ncbi:hypothetical protein NBRC110019_26590 [Neptunitalea chrysea]|uniref:Histidine kinase/HSP90-like ATPase domain-containing protein n=2 Tax=Neptunitalea chrysea TaxID=1647581 RepID=A0A9W6EWT9_9FLAO|nr:hypothetical protein NBRC110019_26590 [Neptunitalea chrysea]